MAQKNYAIYCMLLFILFAIVTPATVDAENDCEKATLWFDRGIAATSNENAISYFQKAIDLCPDLIAAYVNLGIQYFKANNFKKMIQVSEDGLEIDPFYPDLHINLGRAYFLQGVFKEAIKATERAIELDNKKFYAWVLLGFINQSLEDFDSAIQAFENAYNIKKIPENLGYLSYALARADKYQEAEQKANDCIKSYPSKEAVHCYNTLLVIYSAANDPKYHDGQKAVHLGRKIIQLKGKEESWSVGNLALAQARAGDFSSATENMIKSIDLLKESKDEPPWYKKKDLKVKKLALGKLKQQKPLTLDDYF